jgi:hypothetical protein
LEQIMAELIRTPDVVNAIRRAIVRAFKQAAPIVQNYAVANVSGKVLRRSTGALARSIYTRVTRTRTGANLRIGTPVYYGGMWEKGFQHVGRAKRTTARKPGKVMAPRPWLRPAAEQAIPEIVRQLDAEIARELKAFDKKVTIELKLS